MAKARAFSPTQPRGGALDQSSMLAKLNAFALLGIDAVPVEVEVDASAGLPKTVIVYPI